MFQINVQTIYAIKIMAHLAKNGSASLANVAKVEKLSRKYLEQIASQLRIAGLLISARGPLGGYTLAKPASRVTLLQIVGAIQGTQPQPKIKGKVKEIFSRFVYIEKNFLGSFTLADLVD